MSDDTLRHRIAYLVSEQLVMEGSGYGGSGADAAEAIIAMVREALLSDAAVEAATDAYWRDDPGVPRDYGDTENALNAALDAITNGGDGHE